VRGVYYTRVPTTYSVPLTMVTLNRLVMTLEADAVYDATSSRANTVLAGMKSSKFATMNPSEVDTIELLSYAMAPLDTKLYPISSPVEDRVCCTTPDAISDKYEVDTIAVYQEEEVW